MSLLGLLLRYWGHQCIWFETIVHPITITKKGKWHAGLEVNLASFYSLKTDPIPSV